MGKRLNIGLAIDDLDNNFSAQATRGAELAAKALDANLFIYPGHYIGKADVRYDNKEYEYQYNSVFSLPSKKSLDIFYVLLGTIGSRADLAQQEEFLSRFPNIPIVTLFANIDRYPSVTFDNYSGFAGVLKHLITKHGAKNIGYVSGPLSNADAIQRLDAFKKIMAEEGLEADDRHIVYGDFTEESIEVTNELLDKLPGADAILFANDCMAIGGYRALYDRGLVPGKDVKVVGFDDDIFSVSMTPPLTTVEASSADLTYKAVLNAHNFIGNNVVEDLEVETFLVQRRSCGCDGLDIDDMKKRLHFDTAGTDRRFIESVKKYLFGIFEEDEEMLRIKGCLGSFCGAYADCIESKDLSHIDAMKSYFFDLVRSDILSYTSVERLFNVFETMENVAGEVFGDGDVKASMFDTFSDFYRLFSYHGMMIIKDSQNKVARVSNLLNKKGGDIFIMSHENTDPYEQILIGLPSVGIQRTFLYLFQGNTRALGDGSWKCPNTMILQAICDKDGVRTLPEELQLVRTEQIFTNEFVEQDGRRTMTVAPLFVGEDLYGMLVTELTAAEVGNISTIARQIAVTIKSVFLIEEQNRVKKDLQDSLEKFIKDNTILNEAAKSDELTGLYNRRGFLEYARKAIMDPNNRNKKALVCYADMDNLKMVNDRFGHDEGDFSLITIAKILRDAFRSGDIIGRLGGDEFVAFAVVGVGNYETAIKERIESISKKYNEEANKPYPIEVSTGIFEFECSDQIDIYEILDQADEKLYVEKNAKKAKRGSYR